MKKLKSILSAIVVMAMFTACGNNGDDPTPGPKPNPGNKDFPWSCLRNGNYQSRG